MMASAVVEFVEPAEVACPICGAIERCEHTWRCGSAAVEPAKESDFQIRGRLYDRITAKMIELCSLERRSALSGFNQSLVVQRQKALREICDTIIGALNEALAWGDPHTFDPEG